MNNINKKIDLLETTLLLIIVCLIALVVNHFSVVVSEGKNGFLGSLGIGFSSLTKMFDAALGMIIIYLICIIGVIIAKYAPFYLPTVAWISVIAILTTLPFSPIDDLVLKETGKVGVLALTPSILAYAGYAIAKKEIEVFKKSGVKIVFIGILVFIGTFIGSAAIANLILNATS